MYSERPPTPLFLGTLSLWRSFEAPGAAQERHNPCFGALLGQLWGKSEGAQSKGYGVPGQLLDTPQIAPHLAPESVNGFAH